MKERRFIRTAIALTAAAAIAGCSGATHALPAVSSPGEGVTAGPPILASKDAVPAAASKITLTPSSLALYGAGKTYAGSVTVAESKYTGKFTETSTCAKNATASPTSGKGPSQKVTITPAKAASCTITFKDASGNKASLPITVTTTSIALTTASISPGVKSVKVTLDTVGGKPPAKGIITTATTNTTCASGCTVAGPGAPPGSDAFTVTTFDNTNATGAQLATVAVTFTVTSAKGNSNSPTLNKIPAFATVASPAPATAGTAFTTPAPQMVTVADADHNAISGTYTTPVTVSDSDTSTIGQGSALSLDGGAAAHSVQLAKSTDTVTLEYGGLAISSVNISASGTGVTGNSQAFTPTLPAIVPSTTEIDLYNPASGQPGYAGTAALTQAGWKDNTFNNNFTYVLGGTSNNCSSYTVVQASGSANSYTVNVGNSPVVGTCTMTVTGGGGLQTTVTLTYSTVGVGISLKPHLPHGKP